MFLRIGTMRFPSKDKMDAYIAMIQTVFLKKIPRGDSNAKTLTY